MKRLREFFNSNFNGTVQYLYVKYDTNDIGFITEQCFPVENNSLSHISNLNDYSTVIVTIYPQTDNAYFQLNNTGWVAENMFITVSQNELRARDGVRSENISFNFYDTFPGHETALLDIEDNPIDSFHQGQTPTMTNNVGELTPDTVITYTIGTDRLQTCGF